MDGRDFTGVSQLPVPGNDIFRDNQSESRDEHAAIRRHLSSLNRSSNLNSHY